MLTTLLFASLVATPMAPPCVAPVARPVPVASDSLRTLYESGRSFAAFLEAATNRREQWIANHERGAAIDATLVARARAVPGRWRLLVVAIDSCSDSVSTIPYLAPLVDAVEGLEMRIVLPEEGKWVQEAHRTPDGRAATPTIVLLDEQWEVVGCFIERPRVLREVLAQDGEGSQFARKMAWYDTDAGRATVTEIVEMLEGAAAGAPRCE